MPSAHKHVVNLTSRAWKGRSNLQSLERNKLVILPLGPNGSSELEKSIIENVKWYMFLHSVSVGYKSHLPHLVKWGILPLRLITPKP